MSCDIAIQVESISKHFLMFEKPEHRLKQMIVPKLQRLAGQTPKMYYRDFVAVNDVAFEIERGATVGIIGRNGSGKSTLLQMICGTLQPSQGSVKVNGRIAALLELGAGFNPEFTGRENVYMNAAILGLSRTEIEDRFEEIERFADIGIFIDQPVKSYSSGMYVRLAFAVAINVEPDILIVDEALAVGDEAFQRKCFARIEQIKANGATILFVSHGAQTILQLCDRAILMDRGEVILDGVPKTVVNQYQRFVNLTGDDVEPVRDEIKAMDGWVKTDDTKEWENVSVTSELTSEDEGESLDDDEEGWFDPNLKSESVVEYESKGARIRDLRILTPSGRQVNHLKMGRTYVFDYFVDFEKRATQVVFGMLIKTLGGLELSGVSNKFIDQRILTIEEGKQLHVKISFCCDLLPGVFVLNAGIMGQINGEESQYLHRILDSLLFRVIEVSELNSTGFVNLKARPSFTIYNQHQ